MSWWDYSFSTFCDVFLVFSWYCPHESFALSSVKIKHNSFFQSCNMLLLISIFPHLFRFKYRLKAGQGQRNFSLALSSIFQPPISYCFQFCYILKNLLQLKLRSYDWSMIKFSSSMLVTSALFKLIEFGFHFICTWFYFSFEFPLALLYFCWWTNGDWFISIKFWSVEIIISKK